MITCIVCIAVASVAAVATLVFLIRDIKREEKRILSFEEWMGV